MPELIDNAWVQLADSDTVEIAGGSTAIAFAKFQVDSYIRGGAADTGTLWVVFTSGPRQYAYPHVPRIVWDGFLASPSKGKYLNDVVRHYSVKA